LALVSVLYECQAVALPRIGGWESGLTAVEHGPKCGDAVAEQEGAEEVRAELQQLQTVQLRRVCPPSSES
jgi:hypothetical protein